MSVVSQWHLALGRTLGKQRMFSRCSLTKYVDLSGRVYSCIVIWLLRDSKTPIDLRSALSTVASWKNTHEPGGGNPRPSRYLHNHGGINAGPCHRQDPASRNCPPRPLPRQCVVASRAMSEREPLSLASAVRLSSGACCCSNSDVCDGRRAGQH